MITCRELELPEFLFDLASGHLPPDRTAQVHQHLRRCPTCVAYVESYQSMIRLTRRLPGRPMPPGLARRLHAVLEETVRTGLSPGTGPPG